MNVGPRFLYVLLYWAVMVVIAPQYADARAYDVILVKGSEVLDRFGNFVEYYVFAEERAIISPEPVLQVVSPFNEKNVRKLTSDLVPESDSGSSSTNGSSKLVRIYSVAVWDVLEKPFGALAVVGPDKWVSNIDNELPLNNITFMSSGVYRLRLNLTFWDERDKDPFIFNYTFNVDRQPTKLVHTTTVTGYNGSSLFPAPSAQLRSSLDNDVKTQTPFVRLEFQVMPFAASISGETNRRPLSNGFIQFTNIVPSLPGAYTYIIVALLSDNKTEISTGSILINVERALPVKINVLRSVSGVARFFFFSQPLFTIEDKAGLSNDPRQNMTLIISNNAPDFTYQGMDTLAVINGQNSVAPVNYLYNFDGLSINLPGNYELQSRLDLVDKTQLTHGFTVRIEPPPTWEIPEPLKVNAIGRIMLFGLRPKTEEVFIRLSTDPQCVTVSSDEISWPEAEAGSIVEAFNISIVPFAFGTIYICMRLTSQPAYGFIFQNYVPSFNELYPPVLSTNVQGVSSCEPLTSLESEKYKLAGWSDAEAGRRYGCNLSPPVAGTIPPCDCPVIMKCTSKSHEYFNPPNLDIGQCICCTGWVMGVAGTCMTGAFIALLAVIFFYV